MFDCPEAVSYTHLDVYKRQGLIALTRIYLIRHGAPILTAEDRFAGATNVPLSDEGRAQAGRLAQRLKGLPVAAVYASPLDRTMETARILAAPHQLEVHPRDGCLLYTSRCV